MKDTLVELLRDHAYLLLTLGCVIEGDTAVMLAGLAARAQQLRLDAVIAIAAGVTYTMDQMNFWLGRLYGERLLRRVPLIARQSVRAHRLLARQPALAVLGVRFAYGLRGIGSMLLGMSTLPAARYSMLNLLAVLLWATLVASVGWLFGEAAQAFFGDLRGVLLPLFGALVVVAAVLAAVRLVRQRRSDP